MRLPYCTECGSQDIRADGHAEWDPMAGRWELVTAYDAACCDECGSGSVEWAEIENPAQCDNCGYIQEVSGLAGVPDLNRRLSPGDTVPDGECSNCGCFHHLMRESDSETEDKVGEQGPEDSSDKADALGYAFSIDWGRPGLRPWQVAAWEQLTRSRANEAGFRPWQQEPFFPSFDRGETSSAFAGRRAAERAAEKTVMLGATNKREIKPGYVYRMPRFDEPNDSVLAVVAIRPVERGQWEVHHATLGTMTAHPGVLTPNDDSPYAELIEAFRQRFQNDETPDSV